MADQIIKRLPGVKTLYELLPKGAEGGSEFARIVDLLLFHEARRAGKKITIFSDVAGDYHGLDSFEGDVFRKEGTTGYQYKFYPSPLSSEHRAIIAKSLKRTAEKQEQLKLKKWILVTPQDLIESATRKDGGDVTWFEALRKKLGLEFELEHLGHKKLLSLFLETPSLCLFYYPELIPDGANRKKTIQDIRKRYNDNLNTIYSKIEFVGMSVYKQEATRGVPMEHIYIPLTAIPDAADERDANVSRIDPLSFLEPGSRHVVLGDPGSGKSTLLRFLALAGLSNSLQERYKAKPDMRLPILITLRRYADELKARKNLALIDYILESIQGDFNLKSADLDFFEYFLESGQALLLFDGLDELPSSQFKKIVMDRIRTIITTYPGNTTLVTSRIVGYDNPFRFDEKEFVHYRLTRLQLPEIEQFVKDWYRVRIESKREREANVNDLIRILRDEDNIAIRELAQNPLLLTIIALVHRIDAVLPDERVVLYQKCTETLLNTWHTWKFRDAEVKNRGKVERRNRRRMEAIAHWMHCQSGGTEINQRAVVPYADLKTFLTDHIAKIEKPRDHDNDPEDLAEEFIEFVKKRAGLLIEIGDNQYSFVHLTFQEYLSASHIITSSEKDGAAGIWNTIADHGNDARWHEVIRLLVAGLRSDESQEFLIKKILSAGGNGQRVTRSRLLGGLLLDGIEPAEVHDEEILSHLLHSASLTTDIVQLRPITSMLRLYLAKEEKNEKVMGLAFKSLWGATKDYKQKLALVLIASAMNWSETKIVELSGDFLTKEVQDVTLFNLFLGETKDFEKFHSLTQSIELFWAVQDVLSLTSAYGNFVAAAGQAINSSLGLNVIVKRAFKEQMVVLSGGTIRGRGPFIDFTLNSLLITLEDQSHTHGLDRALALARDLDLDLDRDLDRARRATGDFWQVILVTPDLYDSILDLLCDTFALMPRAQWWEALQIGFLPRIPQRISLFDKSMWKQVENAIEKGNAGETEIYGAAWQLIFDSWLYIFGYYNESEGSIFSHLADLTREMEAPPLRIAHCIRDLAYGDESRTDDLVSMVHSEDPQYREIFETCLWRSTPEEEIKTREKK